MALQNPSNPENRFDYVGDIHNQLVSTYISKYGREKRPTEEICKLINEIASQNEDFQERKEEKVDCELIERGIDDFSNQFKNIVNSLDISSETKNKLQELIDYLFELAFKPEDTTYEAYYNHIVRYESEIINDKFSEKDTKVLLSSSSTARYAAYLWKNELKGTETSNSTAKRQWWQWAIIGAADIGGTAGGGVAGGTAASTCAYTLTNPNGK